DTFPFVVKQEIRSRVVRHKDIDPPIIVVIAEYDAKPIAGYRADPRVVADIGECPICIVAVENVRHSAIDVGMAVGTNILKELADLFVVVGEIDISGHVEVYIAIVIDISKGTTCAPKTCTSACGIRNVGKTVLAGIVIELVGPDRGDVKIGPSIVVVIR